jgi:hypothetical protein
MTAFIENGDKLFAPRYEPSDLFYRKGLREFLAACGVRGTSANTLSQDRVFAEGGPLQPNQLRS